MASSGITSEQILNHSRQFNVLAEWWAACKEIKARTGHDWSKIAWNKGKEFYAQCTGHMARRINRLNHKPYKLKAWWRSLTEQELFASASTRQTVNQWKAEVGQYIVQAAKAKGADFYARCIAHMAHCVPDTFPHVVYVAMFNNGVAYIGYTSDFGARNWRHMKGGVVSEYAAIHEDPTWSILEDRIYGKEAARLREKFWIKSYKQQGVKLLNKNGGGSGCGRRLTCSDAHLAKRSLSYKTKTEWEQANRRECREAKRRGLIGTLITHLPAHASMPLEARARIAASVKETLRKKKLQPTTV